jgi:hypothetical protein
MRKAVAICAERAQEAEANRAKMPVITSFVEKVREWGFDECTIVFANENGIRRGRLRSELGNEVTADKMCLAGQMAPLRKKRKKEFLQE